ncbi:NAD dependent epimerase/dehydratase [Boeremia exigua]|uniref:NAD dependent epimerase/dehydratase n=1 Tax=Boeremia exigua TaxID=749465 RepID=UPI001E8D2639|nr:NAD dependent epimerase/dehydratase [Boeremia exigua]KAH6613138.1 NAD dependent epimerase/dehydratase [Boeremia exigua]
MAMFDNPAVAPGSIVLVTGANGFVGAHVADQLLQQGYKVRGTVRDAKKHQWLADLFTNKYGEGRFDLITVKDMKEPDAFDDAVSGVSGIVHVASVRSMNVTPEELLRITVAGTLGCLQAASKEPSVQRFVLTSSSAAVRSLQAYRGTDTVSADEYDNQTLALAQDIPAAAPPMQKFMIAYFASKVAAEQAFWKWVENHKPHFSTNSVLPCTIYGSPLDVPHQGFPSTSKIPLQILDGDTNSIPHVQRFYYVHVQDVARLHVAGLIDPATENERIFAYAGPYSINEFFDIFADIVPGYKAPQDIAGLDFPLAEIGPRGKAEALLKKLGRPGFMGLAETVASSVQTRVSDPSSSNTS